MPLVFGSHPDQPEEARELTTDEVNLVLWLEAEREWHRQVAAWQRDCDGRAQYRAQREREKAEYRAKAEQTLAAHAQLVSTATGLRRAMLERHAPFFKDNWYGHIGCMWCDDNVEGYIEFPCGEYEFVRDWREDGVEG